MIINRIRALMRRVACRWTGNHTWVGTPDALGSLKVRCKYCRSAMWAALLLLLPLHAHAFTKNFNIQFTLAHTVVIAMTEDAYQGDAQYSLTLDGNAAGSGTVTALHGTAPQQVSLSVPDGTHTLAVSFTNDAYGGSPTTDRNLYVESIAYDGVTVPNSTAGLYNTGASLSVTLPPSAAPVPVATSVLPPAIFISSLLPPSVGTVLATVTVTMSDGSTNYGGQLSCGSGSPAVCAGASFVSVQGMNLVLNRAITATDDGHYTVSVAP